MEHRLITGGAQFLPFARSCVTKLKSLGLTHASQSLEVDGVLISVRIEQGHEYIRIEGGTTALAMDSGVIDLINLGVNSPARFSAGVLYPSASMATYIAAFSKAADRGKTNPSPGSAGQLLGTVTVGGADLAGKLLDKAYSFYPAMKETAKDSNKWLPADDDMAVWAKKFVVNACPASMFTGKCRLYVQAMYGKPMYKRRGLDTAGDELGPSSGLDLPVFDGGSRPGLTVWSYDASEEVSLWTSSGVYLDVATGRHFLMNPSGDSMTVYPLTSTTSGEAMRKYITPGTKQFASLDTDDRERAEAYILAYSLPDTKKKLIVDGVGNGAVYTWGMGYGWHWNWSGTTATLTSFITEIDETYGFAGTAGAVPYNVSSRYSLNVTVAVLKDKTFTVTAGVTTDEDNKTWYVNRGYACAVEPDWQAKGMVKSTDRYNRWLAGDAPIYSFYKRDVLQVARVKIALTAVPPNPTATWGGEGEMNPVNGDITSPGFVAGVITGKTPTTFELVVGFSCGDRSVRYTALSYAERKTSFSGFSLGGLVGGFYAMPDGPSYLHSVAYGTIPRSGSGQTTEIAGHVRYGMGREWRYTQEVTQTDVYKIGEVAVAVPIYDAEAVFLYGAQQTISGETTKTTQDLMGVGGYAGGATYDGGEVNWTGWGSTSSATSADPLISLPTSNSDITVEEAVCICSAATAPARTDLMKRMLEDYGDDTVPIGASLFSSVGGVAVSGLLEQSVNTTLTGELLAMVGWA